MIAEEWREKQSHFFSRGEKRDTPNEKLGKAWGDKKTIRREGSPCPHLKEVRTSLSARPTGKSEDLCPSQGRSKKGKNEE